MKHVLLTLAIACASCSPATVLAPVAEAPPPPAAADLFIGHLADLCGMKFEGKLVSSDAVDADMANQRLQMHVRDCSPQEVRIPFLVGEDKSRTWIVTRTAGGLRLKHDHRHADGVEDELSQYGGDTASGGTAERQEFPADAFSRSLFETKGNPASVANVWAIELTGTVFAYELKRPQRFFRVEFDLTQPVSEAGGN